MIVVSIYIFCRISPACRSLFLRCAAGFKLSFRSLHVLRNERTLSFVLDMARETQHACNGRGIMRKSARGHKKYGECWLNC